MGKNYSQKLLKILILRNNINERFTKIITVSFLIKIKAINILIITI